MKANGQRNVRVDPDRQHHSCLCSALLQQSPLLVALSNSPVPLRHRSLSPFHVHATLDYYDCTMTPPPRTPSRYNLRRRPSTATPAPTPATPAPTPRMLRRLNAEKQLLQHPPSEPRLLRSATKKRPVTADPSVSRPSPQSRRPSTAPLHATPRPTSPNQSSLLSMQPGAAEANVSTPPVRRRRPSTAPASDRVLRSASRTRQRDQPQEPIQTSSRKSDVPRAQPPSRTRLTARARALLPRPLNSSKSEAAGNVRSTSAQPRRGRSRSKTRNGPSQIDNNVPNRERSRSRSKARTIRARRQSVAKRKLEVNNENGVSPDAEEMGSTMRRLFHGAQSSQSSSPDFSKWLYYDLVEECKKNGLPYRGKKDEIVSRLQRFHTRAAGALARRSTMETRSSERSRANVSDHQEVHDRNVSNSKLPEREESTNSGGDPGKKDGGEATKLKVESKTDLVHPQPHTPTQRDDPGALDSVQENQDGDESQNISEGCVGVAITASEEDHEKSTEAKGERKPPMEHSGLDEPRIQTAEDELKPSSAANPEEQAVGLDFAQDQDNAPIQQVIPVENEGSPSQRLLANEQLGSSFDEQIDVENKNEQRTSKDVENSESPEEQAADLEGNDVSGMPEESSDLERADPPLSMEAIPQNVHAPPPSKDQEIDTQVPKEAPVSLDARSTVDAETIEAIEEKRPASGSQRSSGLISVDKEIEDTVKNPAVMEGDRSNSTQKEGAMINRVGGSQFESATEHTPPIETAKQTLDTADTEFHIGQQHATIETKDGSPANEMSNRTLLSSLPNRQRDKECENEAFTPSEQGAAAHPLVQPELQEAMIREPFSRWRRSPIERNDDVAQTPDVIDLDAESDGNDDEEEVESGHCNSDSNENSADENQRPETGGVLDDDDVDEDIETPRREDGNESKIPDTDEDNDEDEDDDEASGVNSESPRNDAHEFGAEEGEGPRPMDVTFSEQGEERQGATLTGQKEIVPPIETKVVANKNVEGNEEPKNSLPYTTRPAPQGDEREPGDGEEIKTTDPTEQDGDEVIDLQEDSRMADDEDEEDEEEVVYGDRTVNVDEFQNDVQGKLLSAPERIEGNFASREKHEEVNDRTTVPAVSESNDKGKGTTLTEVEPLLHEDAFQNPQAAFEEPEGVVNADFLKSPELKNDNVSLSADDKESNGSGEELTVAQKGLIKPELKSSDIIPSGEENDFHNSEEQRSGAGKGLIVEVRSQEEQEGKGGEMQLGDLQKTEQPTHVHLPESRSQEVVDGAPHQRISSELRHQQSEPINEDNGDEIGDFPESPLPSPNPPRDLSDSQQDDDFSQSVGHIDDEDHGSALVENVYESETPEEGSQFENVGHCQSETLDDNYASSNLSPAEEDRSPIVAEIESDEEDGPSEDSSPRVDGAGVIQTQNGGVAASRDFTPEANDFNDSLSSDPGQDRGESGIENEAPSQANEVICITSSDDDEAVAKNSARDLPDDIEHENEASKQERQALDEGNEKGEKEKCQMTETPLPITTVDQDIHSDIAPASGKIDREHQRISEHRDHVHLSRNNRGNRDSPLPTGLTHKASRTASRSADIGVFQITPLQRSDSVFSASLKIPASFEETQKSFVPNSLFAEKENAVSALEGRVAKDHQNSPRANPDHLIQGRKLTDKADKLFPQAAPRSDQEVTVDLSTARFASHETPRKRSFGQMEAFHEEDQRPRKFQRKRKMVEFVPMPTPENTIQAFGQQLVMTESRNTSYHEQKSSSILERLRKIQEVKQPDSSSTFRLPPLSATLGQVYNPQQNPPESVMFRQGSTTAKPKNSVKRRTLRAVPEFDKRSFLEESRRRLEAHKRSAPSLQPSRSPFDIAPAESSDQQSSRPLQRAATTHKRSEAPIPGHSKRVTFQAEIPPSKRRKGINSR